MIPDENKVVDPADIKSGDCPQLSQNRQCNHKGP